jgi:hypothetical protein
MYGEDRAPPARFGRSDLNSRLSPILEEFRSRNDGEFLEGEEKEKKIRVSVRRQGGATSTAFESRCAAATAAAVSRGHLSITQTHTSVRPHNIRYTHILRTP